MKNNYERVILERVLDGDGNREREREKKGGAAKQEILCWETGKLAKMIMANIV